MNRIKIVLAEKEKTQKELSAYFSLLEDSKGKGRVSISRWCTNDAQPCLSDLKKVADFLNVPIRELIVDYRPNEKV